MTEQIQDYIDGVLDGDALLRFEQKMQADDAFAEQVRLQANVHEVINRRMTSEEDALRASLAKARAKSRHKAPSGRVRTLYLPMAAVACLVLIVGVFLFRTADQGIYDMPSMPSEIVRGEVGNAEYEDAVLLFNEGKYDEARAILQSLTAAEPDVVQYQYYAALTYVGDAEWREAALALKPLAEGHSIYVDEAKYYLGLSYWKQGLASEAVAVLEQIPEGGKLAEKTKALLEKIK